MINKKEIKAFILSAIAQRNKLLAMRKNQKDLTQVSKAKAFLLAYVSSIPTTKRMAKFFIKHFDKIHILLPPSRYQKAFELFNECENLLTS